MPSGPALDPVDVCIIGAGPAGLSLLSALHDPEGLLTDEQWKIFKRVARGGVSCSKPKVCVVDASGSWLKDWHGRFKSLDIDTLRSPAWATPDYFSTGALLEFATRMGREDELHNVQLPAKVSYLRRDAGAGFFKLPGSAIFRDFCNELVKKLPHTLVLGVATDVTKRQDNTYDVIINGHIEPVHARSVVSALGAANSPTIPAALTPFLDGSNGTPSPRVIHTFSWSELVATPFAHQTVVIVGGGLSAAQAALMAVRRGARKVVHVSRRPVRSRHYDLPIEWMEPRSGWRVANRDKSKKFRMYEFYDTPKSERAAWVKDARGGATVPVWYLEELERVAKTGILERWVDEIAEAEHAPGPGEAKECDNETGDSDGGRIRLRFSHRSKVLLADRIVLATGSTLDINKVPLLRNVATRFDLPVTSSLPDLDNELMWGEENFSVLGAFALLEMGPDSGNLTGCRRSAGICARNVGSFEQLAEAGGPLSNTFSLLLDSDDSSDSEDDDA